MAKTVTIGGRDTGRTGSGSGGGKSGGGSGLEGLTEKEIVSLVKSFTEIKNPQSRKKIIELVKTMA
jgi:hypothetical protein